MGWNFSLDHVLHRLQANSWMIDSWIALATIAANTKKIMLGPMITPLARRRPWKVARESVSLDHLSKGRLILGAGLGATVKNDFQKFGEEIDKKMRAEKLDESLEILQGLWKGKPFSFSGKHYTVEEAAFLPRLYGDKSKIPIWIGGGSWPRHKHPFRRAASLREHFQSILTKTERLWRNILIR